MEQYPRLENILGSSTSQNNLGVLAEITFLVEGMKFATQISPLLNF